MGRMCVGVVVAAMLGGISVAFIASAERNSESEQTYLVRQERADEFGPLVSNSC